MNSVELLIRTAFEALSSMSSKSPSKIVLSSSEQLKLREVLEKLNANDVKLHESMGEHRKTIKAAATGKPPSASAAPITYIDIFNHRLFTIGIFVLHPNGQIPLHDHPGMYGFIKVLCGELKITSFTKVKSVKPQGQWNGLIAQEEQNVLNSTSPVAVLSPSERNYHKLEFVRGESEQRPYIAILDILAPPYNNNGRSEEEPECNYYCQTKTKLQLGVESGSSVSKPLVELRKCSCPEEFYNDNAPYVGPSVAHLYSQLR